MSTMHSRGSIGAPQYIGMVLDSESRDIGEVADHLGGTSQINETCAVRLSYV
jgi:hypothetical protein